MKFVLLTALAFVASAMKITKKREAHKTIFQGCSKDTDCPKGKYWHSGAWNFCKDYSKF